MSRISSRRAFALTSLALACLPVCAGAQERSAAPYSWTGFYVGFNYGYAWKGAGGVSTLGAPLYDTTFLNVWPAAAAIGAGSHVDARLNGFMGGAQAGYRLQFPTRIVLGVEADIQAGGVNGGGGFGSILPGTLPGTAVVTSGESHRTLEHFGTVRANIGYAVTPTSFAYLTGGLAYGGVNVRTTINQSLNPSALLTANARSDVYRERIGWTIGIGAETAISRNLSAKLEFLHYDLGRVGAQGVNSPSLAQINPLTGAAVVTAVSSSSRIAGQIVRAGLNYRLGGDNPVGAPAAAAPPAPPTFGDWSVSITPYVWMMGINGSSTAMGQTTAANVSFVDMLTKSATMPLEVAANAEVRNGPLAFYLDFVWAQVRIAGSGMALRNPIAGASLTLGGEARLKNTIAIVEGGAAYEVGRWNMPALSGTTAVDLLAGLRYWNVGLDLALDIAGAVNLPALGLSQTGSKAIARSGTLDWVDPFIGIRVRQFVDAANAFYIKGDIGGFGIGSKFAWQAAGGYTHDFQFADRTWTTMVGYRALRADYSQGSGLRKAGMNAILHGPTMGVGMKF